MTFWRRRKTDDRPNSGRKLRDTIHLTVSSHNECVKFAFDHLLPSSATYFPSKPPS